MQDLSIVKTADMSPAAKEFEALLGRHLRDDEEVTIWASGPHEAPTGEARRDAWKTLDQHLDVMASKAGGGPTEELERLVDGICGDVRHGR